MPITKHTRKLAAVGVAAALIVGGVTAAAASVLTGSSDNRVEIPAGHVVEHELQLDRGVHQHQLVDADHDGRRHHGHLGRRPRRRSG